MRARRSMMKMLEGIAAALLLTGAAGTATAQTGHEGHDHPPGEHPVDERLVRTEPWTEEALETFALLPVQDRGRVKPLGTFAGFQLLKINGKRTHELEVDGEDVDLTALEWLLDCLFYPETARHYEVFRIQNSDVLDNVGLHFDDKKRADRYSYEQLLPGRQRLMKAAQSLIGKETKDMSMIERQTMALATNVRDYEQLTHYLDFARYDFQVDTSGGLQTIWKGEPTATLSGVLSRAESIQVMWSALSESQSPKAPEESRALDTLLAELDYFAGGAHAGPGLIPPTPGEVDEDKEAATWLMPRDGIRAVFESAPSAQRSLDVLAGYEALERSKGDPAAFQENLEGLHAQVANLADERGEYEKIPAEVAFYEVDYFTKALVFFLLGFLLTCLSWLGVGKRWFMSGAWISTGAAIVYLIVGITWRCILRDRPPISTLYETILSIAAIGVIVCMVTEYFVRIRFILAVGSFAGALLMFMAMKYEFKEATTSGDTMPVLVAVLDTNYYLAIHVTTICFGYGGGLFASLMAHVWLFGTMFGIGKGSKKIYKTLARVTYGILCFGLLFSVFGTIMGGIWANDSWGRFWGWDPKENGALMICLWMLLTIHARLGGYIRDFGLCVMNVIGGLVVLFSWFGVNLLGVGLHSYGFTSGVAFVLAVVYAIEGVVLLGAGLWRLLQWRHERTLQEFKLAELEA